MSRSNITHAPALKIITDAFSSTDHSSPNYAIIEVGTRYGGINQLSALYASVRKLEGIGMDHVVAELCEDMYIIWSDKITQSDIHKSDILSEEEILVEIGPVTLDWNVTNHSSDSITSQQLVVDKDGFKIIGDSRHGTHTFETKNIEWCEVHGLMEAIEHALWEPIPEYKEFSRRLKVKNSMLPKLPQSVILEDKERENQDSEMRT